MRRLTRRGFLGSAAAAFAGEALFPGRAQALLMFGGGATPSAQQALGIFDVKSYGGAVGDTIMLAAGSMSSVTNPTHFSDAGASFVSGDVGKVICVGGAGASGAPLVTTISSVTSGTAVVLGASCLTTVSGAITHYGTDDTTAIQNTINAAVAFGNGNGVALFPLGIYMINGAFQNTSVQNSQLIIPTNANPTSSYPSVVLMGYAPATQGDPGPLVLNNTAPKRTGAILFSPKNGSGTHPALLAAGGYLTTTFNVTRVTIGNLTFRTAYQNPNPLSACNMSNAIACVMDDVCFDVDATSNQIANVAPVSGSVAYLSPCVNNGTINEFRGAGLAVGYDIGYSLGEHFSGEDIQAYFCTFAATVGDTVANEALHVSKLDIASCQKGVWLSASVCPLHVSSYIAEHNTSAGKWFSSSIEDVHDPGNKLTGILNYHIVVSNVGSDNSQFVKTGATGLTTTAI